MPGSAELARGPIVPQLEKLLRERLRRGYWQTGERLPNELAIAAEFGVGRSSVREAVRLLAQDGLVEVRHGSGTYVVAGGSPELVRLLRSARLLEVYEARRALEVEAGRLAALRARDEDLELLAAELDRRQLLIDRDPAEFVLADLDFHRMIIKMSGNQVLLDLFDSFRPKLTEAQIELARDEPDMPDTSCAHRDVVAALKARDQAATVAATVANLDPVMALLSEKEGAEG